MIANSRQLTQLIDIDIDQAFYGQQILQNLADIYPSIKNYKYSLQSRSKSQINLTNCLANAVSQNNLNRIHRFQQQIAAQYMQNQDFCQQLLNQIMFVCVHGVPSLKAQYQFLDLPKQSTIIDFYPACFSPNESTEQEKLHQFHQSSFEAQANNLYKKIQAQPNNKSKKIILLFHSFGTFITHSMFIWFPQIKQRVIGMIDLGGAPVRFPQSLILSVIKANAQLKNKQYLLQNADNMFEKKTKNLIATKKYQSAKKSNKKSVFMPDQNKYQTIAVENMMMSPQFKIMFEQIRNGPNVLRLVIYGKNDNIFGQSNLHEKAIYFGYVRKLPQIFENFVMKFMKDKYKGYFQNKNLSCVNSRFLFCFVEGGHSIHFQKKLKADIKRSVHEYINVILSFEHSLHQ